MKPSLAKGTRDFTPTEIYKRKYIIGILEKNFELFGFQPLETPSFENLSTLTGKYGEEGDRLIFKILNSGNFLNKVPQDELQVQNYHKLTAKISDKALRYDLTVPFARFVAMNHGQLNFPYKRYQIQPVWRADRPQKGRFREFLQCDADVVGSQSIWQEIELVQLYIKSFSDLKINAIIHINNRKILSGLAQYADISTQIVDFTVALDKLDKIGKDGVVTEMKEKGISQNAIEKLSFLFDSSQDSIQMLAILKEKLAENEIGLKGIEETEFVIKQCIEIGVPKEKLKFDVTLARGLDYYTGAIFEIKARDVDIGSIGGGGRYDSLTEVFGIKNIPGIGISFGLDRIYLVMEELGLFPTFTDAKTRFLFANYGDKEALFASGIIAKLRNKGIAAELYPEATKLKKQFSYAERKGIAEIVFVGEKEIEEKTITIKNLSSGVQITRSIDDFLNDF